MGDESPALAYALITPTRNEERNLKRLAACIADQVVPPTAWLIVDNGSEDETRAVAESLITQYPRARFVRIDPDGPQARGAPVVRAFTAGLRLLGPWPEIVVKLDADVSFDADYFRQLLTRFDADGSLGIASGLCLELADGQWRSQHSTRSHVRGAVRAYRRECLREVLPLEERMGWDGIDEIKAAMSGWRTATFHDMVFFHHRALGERESAIHRWERQGEMAHYMGYRPSYLALRALYRSLRDPAAMAMIIGFARSAALGAAQYPDPHVRDWLRREQSLRAIPTRAREALGRTPTSG